MVIHGREHLLAMVQLVGQLLLDVLRLLRAPLRGPGAMCRATTTWAPWRCPSRPWWVSDRRGAGLSDVAAAAPVRGRAFIVNILGISLIRELGPLLGAILVAGRSGSAITADRRDAVTEELDAMQVMGIPQGYRLVCRVRWRWRWPCR
jgi:phospholipid/cholesterol/gamma-HCH transport system permease protein